MHAFRLPFSDRRKSKRIKAYKKAMILYHNKAHKIDCKVLDSSDKGARLETPEPMLLPHRFDLRFASDLTIRCEIVRRNGGEIGVKFI